MSEKPTRYFKEGMSQHNVEQKESSGPKQTLYFLRKEKKLISGNVLNQNN